MVNGLEVRRDCFEYNYGNSLFYSVNPYDTSGSGSAGKSDPAAAAMAQMDPAWLAYYQSMNYYSMMQAGMTTTSTTTSATTTKPTDTTAANSSMLLID